MAPETGDNGDDSNTLLANGGKIVSVIVCGFAAIAAFTSMAEMLGSTRTAILTTIMAVTAFFVISTGWLSRTSNAAEFYGARSQLSPAANALGGLAGWLAVPAFTGLAGVFFTFGFDGLAFAAGPMAGLVLAGVLITPYLAASKAVTVPGFLGARYGAATRVIATLVIASVSFIVFAAALSTAVALAMNVFDVPLPYAAGAVLFLIAVSTLPGGINSLTWTGVVTAIVFLISLTAATVGMSMSGFGQPLPPLAVAGAVQAISNLEISMIEKGLADAVTMKPYAKPFLQIDSGNVFGMILSLMATTAALPHLLQRSLTVRSPHAARASTSWLLALMLLVLLSASAWSAFAKLEVVSMIERGTAFAVLPDWLGKLGHGEGARIQGLSSALVEDVIAVVKTGAQTGTQVSDALHDRSASSAVAWAGLKEPLKALIIEVAKSAPADGVSQYAWTALRDKILPAASLSAGNKTGFVTLSALKIDGEALMQDLPEVLGQSATTTVLVAAGALFGALAIASAGLFNAAAVLSHDLFAGANNSATPAWRVAVARVLILLLGLGGAASTILPAGDWPAMAWLIIDWRPLVAIALPAAAAALLPALIMGIWWRRANALGAVLAMLAGLAIALVYAIGTRYFPVELYNLWPAASDALPAAAKRFETLTAALALAQGDQTANIAAALKAHAGGTPFVPGVANWWGLGGASALVFAVPVGFVVLVLGALVGPRPSQAQNEFVTMIRQPQDPKGSPSTVS